MQDKENKLPTETRRSLHEQHHLVSHLETTGEPWNNLKFAFA